MCRTRISRAFHQGWNDGALFGEATAAEASARYPEYTAPEIDAYCQGTVDGKDGDTFRRDVWED